MLEARRAVLMAAFVLLVSIWPTAANGVAPDLPAEAPAYLPWLIEAARIVELYGGSVWPGWQRVAPILVRDGPLEYLIGHPAPPPPFVPVHDLVHRRVGHLTPAPVATTWPVDEVWSVAVPAPLEFQAIVDAALGPGVVVIDSPTYVRVVIHESFHAYQLTTSGGIAGLPRFGLDGPHATERGAVQVLMGVDDLDRRHAAQGAALVEALEAADAEQATLAARRFLALREEHRLGLPDEVIAYERSIEWIEGTARYADTRLMRMAASDPQRSDAVAYATAELVWQTFTEQLLNPSQHDVGLRDRYAAIGAAQGMLLDRLLPDWHGRVLPGGEAVEDVLRDALERQRGAAP